MAAQLVVAVFDSYGIARDARNRLHTEGVPHGDVSLKVLREVAPSPPSLEPTIEAMEVDPLVFGNVRETFARFIRNGESAVMVRAHTDAEVEFAATIMRLYEPVAVEIMTLHAAV
jgi:hypothetical protein